MTVVILYAAFAALWILLSDKAVEWLLADPAQITLASTIKGWAFVVVTSLLLYGLMRRLLGGTAGEAARPLAGYRAALLPLALLIAVIAALTAGAIAHTANQQKKKEISRLQAIADLKTRQIEDWLAERYGNARFAQANRLWADLYRRWRRGGDRASGAMLQSRLRAFQEHHRFRAMLLLDETGNLLWDSEGGTSAVDPALGAAGCGELLPNSGVTHLGPYRNTAGRLHLDFLARLPIGEGRPGPTVVLRVDPADHLFPTLRSWPTPNSSGEVLLFRRDGDRVQYLDTLRQATGAKLQHSAAAEDAMLLTTKILRGDTGQGGPMEGVDYRGVPVIGLTRAVGGTDWLLVAKVDLAEVYGETARDAIWIGLAGLLALFMAVAVTFLFRQRQALAVALREREIQAEKLRALQLLDAIAEGSADAIFAKDREGRYLLFNREAARVTGKAPQDVLGRDDTAIFPPREAALIMANDRQVMENNRSVTFQEELTTTGGEVTFLATKGPLRDGAGAVIGLFGISRDITDRKQAEEALRQRLELQDQLAKISATVPGVVLSFRLRPDGSACMPFSTPPIEDLFGIPKSVLAEDLSPFYANVHPDDIKHVMATVAEAARIPSPWHDQYRYCHPTKGQRWIEGWSLPRTEPDGSIVWHGFVMDITERKGLEAEQSRFAVRLRQAEKMEALGTLAGGIAHDFNNILGIISGFTELALAHSARETQAQPELREILKAAGRAKELVQQILAFSRRGDQEKRPIQVGLIVREALKMLRASLPSTVEIKTSITSDAIILGDPTQIHQVLMNLCSNAGHAMQNGGGTLEVNLRDLRIDPAPIAANAGLAPGLYVKLTVGDTGHGMTPEILERIFDPFFTTKEQGVGTGLGLSIVHRIVNSHGGAIEVESLAGRGTVFEVLLPAVELAPLPETAAAAPLPCGRERILVVDDEPALADVMKLMLEHLGYEVDCRTSGPEALAAFRRQGEENPFDLVITDMTMPRLTGVDLARELLRLRPGLPVLLCTGFSERINAEEARLIGIHQVLLKPVTMQDLALSIRATLGGRAS